MSESYQIINNLGNLKRNTIRNRNNINKLKKRTSNLEKIPESLTVSSGSETSTEWKNNFYNFQYYSDGSIKRKIEISKDDMFYFIMNIFSEIDLDSNFIFPDIDLSNDNFIILSKSYGAFRSKKFISNLTHVEDISGVNVVDLSSKYIPMVLNQGQLGSCFVNPTASILASTLMYHDTIMEGSTYNGNEDDKRINEIIPSRTFLQTLYKDSNDKLTITQGGLPDKTLYDVVSTGVPIEIEYTYDWNDITELKIQFILLNYDLTLCKEKWDNELYDTYKDILNELYQKYVLGPDTNIYMKAKTSIFYKNIIPYNLFNIIELLNVDMTKETITERIKYFLYWGYCILVTIPVFTNFVDIDYDGTLLIRNIESSNLASGQYPTAQLIYPTSDEGGYTPENDTGEGHAMYLYGYKDNIELSYYTARNSWSSDWGDNGDFRVNMAFFEGLFEDINYKNMFLNFCICESSLVRKNNYSDLPNPSTIIDRGKVKSSDLFETKFIDEF